MFDGGRSQYRSPTFFSLTDITMDLQTIILAAGKGTRMGASAQPKVLVHLRNMPLISHLLAQVGKLKTEYPPVVVVGYKYELIQSALGDSYTYAFQQGQMGTAHAVKAAIPHAKSSNILVLYGDMPMISHQSLLMLADHHIKTNSDFTMFTAQVPHFNDLFASHQGFGRVIRKEGKLEKIVEFSDATDEERNITEVNPGIYIFKREWLSKHIEYISKNKHNEFYLTDIVEIAIKNNTLIQTLTIDPLEVYGINTPQQLKQAEQILDSVTK